MNIILKPIEPIIGLFSDTKKSTGTMDSACKMVTNGLKVLEVGVNVVSPAMVNLSKSFAFFSELAGALNIIDRAYEWISPKKRDGWTWQKYTSTCASTVGNSLEFAGFLKNAGIINLGSFGSQVAPGIIPLDVVKSAFYIPASLFGIWHSIEVMMSQDNKVAGLEGKVTKWTLRQQACQNKDHFLNVEIPLKLKKIKNDIILSKKMGEIKENITYSKLVNRQKRWKSYAFELRKGNESASLNADCKIKIVGYQANEIVAKANSDKVKTKEWIAVASSIGKFIFGILGLVGTFLGLFAFPLFTASLAAGWFATHGLNVASVIYGERNNVIAYQTPHLEAVA